MARRDGPEPLDLLDPVAAEATRWFVLLHEDPSDLSRSAKFAAWRDADPAHASAYARIQRLWGASGHIPSLQDRAGTGIDRRSMLRSGGGAALMALVAAGGARLALGPHPLADYTTGIGERRTVALSDGSLVELATSTAVSVHFNAPQRRVELLDGEAWFRVAKDPAGRPFVVEASGGSTTALGTAFAVARDADAVTVSVTEHATRVEAAGEVRRVEAGQSCRYDTSGPGRNETTDPTRLAWREGRLAFISRPLSDVVATLDRWRLGKTIILDDALAAHPVTLMIDVTEVGQALTRLGASLPMRIVQITPLLTLIRAAT